MFIIHSATTPFSHFIRHQGIKDVFWTNMKHTTKQEPAVSPRSSYSRELSFMTCFKPSEFVSQLFPAVLAASYWNLFCWTLPSAFRSKWKGFKLHSEIQSKKSNNFTPKSHWEHTNCSYHPNSLSLHFSGSHSGSWRTEGQSSPKMTPSTCQMFLA